MQMGYLITHHGPGQPDALGYLVGGKLGEFGKDSGEAFLHPRTDQIAAQLLPK